LKSVYDNFSGKATNFKFDDSEILASLSKCLVDRGLDIPLPVFDHNFHRFSVPQGKSGNKDGSYILHNDGIPAGRFWNYQTDESFVWSAISEYEMTDAERTVYREQMLAAKAEHVRIRAEEYSAAAKRAKGIWDGAKPATDDHPYLKKKKGKTHGIRKNRDGRLVIPLYGADGNIQTVQFISDDGDKKFLTDGKKSGGFFCIPGNHGRIAIAEGYATAASIHEATGATVYVGFDAGNLLSVATTIKTRHPGAQIVICCDNDQWKSESGNPGLTKGREAAEAIGALTAVPIFKDMSTKPTDFNDLLVLEGIEEVKRQIEAVTVETSEAESISDPEAWPVLDDAAYKDSDFLWAFIKTACEDSEADPSAVLITFLTRFSVEVGNGPFIWIGDGKQRVNLLAGIVGTTGNGRKGTSAKPITRLFELKVNGYSKAASVPGPLSSGEGIIFAVRDPVNKLKNGEEVIDDPGVTDKRLYIQSEELAGAFKVMQREGNTLSTIIRQIYDSGDLAPLIKNNKNTATGAHIGIVGHITGYELDKLLEQNEIHNGLINRFMWVCSRRQGCVPFPRPISSEALAAMQKELLNILRYARAVTEMEFSKKSKELWATVYPDLTQERYGIIGDVLARATNHVIRLSMLHALLDKKSIIEPCHIQAALATWRYCEQSARYIFESQAAGDPLQRKILDALQDGPKTATDIYNLLQKNIKSSRIKTAIKELMSQNKIDSSIEKGSGPPKTTYFLK